MFCKMCINESKPKTRQLETWGKILFLMSVFWALIFFVSRAEWRVFFVLMPGLQIRCRMWWKVQKLLILLTTRPNSTYSYFLDLYLYLAVFVSVPWQIPNDKCETNLLQGCARTCVWGRHCPRCGSRSWGRTAWNPGRVQNIKCVRRKSNERLPPQIFLL